MGIDDGFKILRDAVRDERVAEAVLAAGIGLVFAFILLHLGYKTTEPVALIIGFTAISVGLVSIIEMSKDVDVIEKNAGVTWDDLAKTTWDELKERTWDDLAGDGAGE